MSQLGGWGMNQPLTCSCYDIRSPCSTPPSLEAVTAGSQSQCRVVPYSHSKLQTGLDSCPCSASLGTLP